MVFDVVGRAVNDVLAGRASAVDVTLTPYGGVRVADDGPGVPVEAERDTGGPSLEALLTHMHPGTEPGGRHAVASSLFGVGPRVTNALSSRLTAEVRREGVTWVQEYARGVALTPPTIAGPTTRGGTTIAFWPDTDIFETAECSFAVLAERFRELAFLNRGLDISLTDERPRTGPDRYGAGSRAGLGTSSPSSTRRRERPFTQTSSASSGKTRGSPGRSRWPCGGVAPTRSGSRATPTASPHPTVARTWRDSATGGSRGQRARAGTAAPGGNSHRSQRRPDRRRSDGGRVGEAGPARVLGLHARRTGRRWSAHQHR